MGQISFGRNPSAFSRRTPKNWNKFSQRSRGTLYPKLGVNEEPANPDHPGNSFSFLQRCCIKLDGRPHTLAREI